MPNPSSDYPTTSHSPTDVSAFTSSKLGSTNPKHTDVEGKQEETLKAITDKLGPGTSNAASATTGQVLTKKVSGNTEWTDPAAGGVTDHGALTGLSDDDHSQYHNDTRGDLRYPQLVHTHVEADITDLQTYLTTETDPVFMAWDKSWDDITDKPSIPTAQEYQLYAFMM